MHYFTGKDESFPFMDILQNKGYEAYCQAVKDHYPRFRVPSKLANKLHYPETEADVPVFSGTYTPSVSRIFQLGFKDFYKKYGDRLDDEQRKAGTFITICRTPAMGVLAVSECDNCGATDTIFNCCGNRNCTCHAAYRKKVEDKLSAEDYPCAHYHIVFTIPFELRDLFWLNQKILYDVLIRCAKDTVIELCMDPNYLGVKPGLITVLHTWNQLLEYHPHVHMVLLAGGLDSNGKFVKKDENSDKSFFIPVRVLRDKFQGKFLDNLKKLIKKDRLVFPDEWKSRIDADSHYLHSMLDDLYKKEWAPYIKNATENPNIMEYLARYTNKIAIGNSRILEVTKSEVTIQYRDSLSYNQQRVAVMPVETFIGRYLNHVLPSGFQKMRRYGMLASRCKRDNLEKIRSQLKPDLQKIKPRFKDKSALEISEIVWKKDIRRCPKCHQDTMNTVYLAEHKDRHKKWTDVFLNKDNLINRASQYAQPMLC